MAADYDGAVYTRGLAQRTNTLGDRFFHTDWLGSTRYTSDGTGFNLPATLNFDAFGNRGGTGGVDPVPSTPFEFAGAFGYQREYETASEPGVGLQYLEQRYYDPAVGRFISPDPIGFAGGLNLYGYGAGDPVGAVDPSGTERTDPNTGLDPDDPLDSTLLVVLRKNNIKALFNQKRWDETQQARRCLQPGLGPPKRIEPPGNTLLNFYRQYIEGALLFLSGGRRGGGESPGSDEMLPSSRAARRQAMREYGVPTSQQPVSRVKSPGGDQYVYEVPGPGGKTREVVVTHHPEDPLHGPHWEAGTPKENHPLSYDPLGRRRYYNVDPATKQPKARVRYNPKR
jgi:RHS repeat-associated protein